MLKRFLILATLLGLTAPLVAQITVPNTLVAGTTITAAGLNTNFTTIANHALDRISGGNLTGNVTADALVTLDGVDVGVQACVSCTPTHSKLTLSDTSATSLTVGGGMTIGTGAVALVNTTGKIPAISSTYFASLAGTNLTGVALLGSANVFTSTNTFQGVTTFSARGDLLTYTETKSVVVPGGAPVIDLALGTHFTYSNLAAPTFTISNPPTSGKAGSFTLAITGDGNSRPPVWTGMGTVKWAAAAAPTITITNGKTDILTFLTYDGGTTWYGFVGGQNF